MSFAECLFCAKQNAGPLHPFKKGTEKLGGTTLINHRNSLQLSLSPLTLVSRCIFTQRLQGRFYTFLARILHHMILSLGHVLYILVLFTAIFSSTITTILLKIQEFVKMRKHLLFQKSLPFWLNFKHHRFLRLRMDKFQSISTKCYLLPSSS